MFFGKKTPYGQIFTNVFQNPTCGHGITSFCAHFVKLGRPEVSEIARYLMDKKKQISARAPAAAFARIAPKICQGQLCTICSEFPKFHRNPFTSGGVVAERVNIVQTRHKVFAILGEASASSPSSNKPRPAELASYRPGGLIMAVGSKKKFRLLCQYAAYSF